jgi:hypothetical protein
VRPVDRSTFLDLTRALVARSRVSATATAATVVVAACGPGGAVDGAPVTIPKQPLAPARAAPKVAKGASSGPRGDVAPPAPTDEGDDESDGDTPDTCGEVDTRNVLRPQGTCNDATPVAFVCSGCAKVGFGATKCASLSKSLKPKVAKAAADCIARLPPSCDPCAVYACGDRAMKASCPDPSADVECRALQRTCPSISLDVCSRYVSALVPGARPRFKACMTSCNLYSCAEGL